MCTRRRPKNAAPMHFIFNSHSQALSPPVTTKNDHMKANQRKQTPKFRLIALACASLLAIFTATSSRAASGTWISTASGNWSTTGNWSGGVVADGSDGSADTAFFNTLDLAADVTVTLDTVRTNANLVFADANTNTPANWFLSGSKLTLGGATPRITVTNIAPGES